MSFSARLARLRGPLALAAAAAMGASALLPVTASAQQQPAPQQQQQRPRPAQPAEAPAAQGQAQSGPQIVAVKPEPSQPDWTKVCGKDQATNAEICYTTRDFVSDQGQPVLAVAVYDVKGGQAGQPTKIVRFLMPLGLLLQPGVRFAVDQGKPTDGKYGICFPNGCFAEAPVADDVVNQFKRGTTLNISIQNQLAQVVTFAVPLAGFGKAFDGAPVDPKALQEQQRKLQEELQKRSDELRKRLEQQSGAAPSAAGAAPAAAPRQ